jgi:hypothetical protein
MLGPPWVPGHELVLKVGQVQPTLANAANQRVHVLVANPQVRDQREQGDAAARSAEPERLDAPTEQQRDSRERHRGIDGHPLDQGAHPAPEALRDGVVGEVSDRRREGVLEHLAVQTGDDRDLQSGVDGERDEAQERERRMNEVRPGHTETPDEPRGHPDLDDDLGEVAEREEDAEEGGQRARRREGRDEDLGVEVLRREECDGHADRRDDQPAPECATPEVVDGADQPLERSLVLLDQIDETPANQLAAAESDEHRGGHEE